MGEVNVDGGWPRLQRAVEDAAAAGHAAPRHRLAFMWRRPPVLSPGVYVFAFHSIIDPAACQPWERAYEKVAITTAAFRSTLAFLAEHLVPLSLSEALTFVNRAVDRPYAVVTFDDGYTNNLTHAAPIAAAWGFRPALFVNAAFADGSVYYRVLAAMLTSGGHGDALATELRRTVPAVAWSADPKRLFNQTKDEYVRGAVEAAVRLTYERVAGDPAMLHVHLNAAEVGELVEQGWELGNHTFGHDVLAGLREDEVADTIHGNDEYWRARELPLLPCIAYPNGAAKHAGAGVNAYLRRHPDRHGMFCNGGVNIVVDRTEWLRIPVSPSIAASPAAAFGRERAVTERALQSLA